MALTHARFPNAIDVMQTVGGFYAKKIILISPVGFGDGGERFKIIHDLSVPKLHEKIQ